MTEQYKSILKKINRNADGDVMIHMYKRGVKYKRSYGVKLIVLKEMVKQFEGSHDLAAELWESNIREMRIFASMLQPLDSLTEEQMNNWSNDFNNPEIVEQACINLFQHSALAEKIAFEWCIDDKEYVKMAGFLLISLITPKISENVTYLENTLDLALVASDSDSLHVKNGIVRALVGVGKVNKEFNFKAMALVNQIKATNTENSKYIVDNAQFQIEFAAESL